MKTFSTVEDYLEVIAGKRELDGKLPTNTLSWAGLGYDFKPIVSLARYDVNFLDSVTDSTLDGTSLTDRQSELALKIISKYHRQLHAQGISIDEIVKTPVYRKPIRVVDRSRSIQIQDGEIVTRFTFEQKLIEYIRDNAKISQGRVKFDKNTRQWRMALTEYNVNWVSAFANSNQFVTDAEFGKCMQAILDCEAAGYELQLQVQGEHLTIVNAPAPLLEYLGQPNNQFDIAQAARLVDQSSVLGYTVHSDLMRAITDHLGSTGAIMLANREYDFKTENWNNLEHKIYQYAVSVNRFPIVIFDPQCNFAGWKHTVEHEHVLDLSTTRQSEDAQVCANTTARVILTNRAIKYMDRIALLISNMGMIVGQDKRIMIDASEKVFYTNGKLA
jgi:hypothetical protein